MEIAIGLHRVLACLAVAGFATNVAATPITYIESVNGDLAQTGLLPTLALDVGTNTVSGRSGATETTADFDAFAFSIPVGTELVALQVALTDAIADASFSAWSVHFGSANAGAGPLLGSLVAPSPGSASFGSTLAAGLYNMYHEGFSLVGGTLPVAFDYTFTLTLRELNVVPEPGSLALAGLALLAAAATTRRRSAR